MHLPRANANEVSQTSNRSRDWNPQSGICTRCIDACRGNCEIWKASLRGREVLYPGPFGTPCRLRRAERRLGLNGGSRSASPHSHAPCAERTRRR